MSYTLFSSILFALAFIFIIYAISVLFKKAWFLQWLRGSFGILIAIMAVGCAAAAWDLSSYKKLSEEKAIVNISFTQQSSQLFTALIEDENNTKREFTIAGDSWQLDTRVIRWHPWVERLGVKPGYRLERIGGRYYSLEQEQSQPRSVHGLNRSKQGVDIWRLVQESKLLQSLVDARYGSATYLPMADGAYYTVALLNGALVTRPLNDAAKLAIDGWN